MPAADFLRLRPVADLLRQPRWLAGMGTMICGQVLSAWVVGHIVLAVSEPLLATNLLVALALAWPFCGGAVVTLPVAGRRRSQRTRAMLTGTAAGLAFGVQDALTRRTVDALGGWHALAAILGSWPVYGLVAASIAGLWLMQNRFSTAPLHACLPAITAAEPVCGMVLGIAAFREWVPASAGMITLQVAGLVTLVAGVVLVARAPALTALHAGGRRQSLPG